MKLEERIKLHRYVQRNDLDVKEDKGFVTIPSWQFVLLLQSYEEIRSSSVMALTVIAMITIVILFLII